MKNFKNLKDTALLEKQDREALEPDKACVFGIKPLDEALISLDKNDLVVIGADSGGGKSEVALRMARVNAKMGRRVALYSLEGGSIQAMRRMKWQDICENYYANYHEMGVDMDYRKWSKNKDRNGLISEIEQEVIDNKYDAYKDNLMFFCGSTLSLDDLLHSLLDFHDVHGEFISTKKASKFNLDLIIIDHLQYFSLTKDESEISEITEILKSVKRITEEYAIPVVLISHMRKKSKDRGLPGQEDFHGSSNIPKIASVAITISSASDNADLKNMIYPTYIRVVKSRMGISPLFAFLINFDGRQKKYMDNYQIFRVNSQGFVPDKPLDKAEFPDWAQGAI